MRRRFNGSERVALYLASGGRCAECGAELEPGWHGDHRTPYSRGGETELANGQALCPDCNLRKGNRMSALVQLWPEQVKPRQWAMEAFRAYLKKNAPDFLAVATPGAGKTLFGLYVAHSLLQEGSCARLVVVTPTEHLKKQWRDAAAKIGLQLNSQWENSKCAEAVDYHGVIVTYQQVAQAPDLHRMHTDRRPTVVIFDEIHHVGDGAGWGYAVRAAFESATRRLALTGTAFRSDYNPIPFVVYDDRRSVADFTYSYGRALGDRVCRNVIFPSLEGRMEWLSRGSVKSATFADELGERETAERLKTALSPQCEWLATALEEADTKLNEIRAGEHREAGGLIITMHQWHAREVATLLEQISGEAPVIAISDEPDASERIEQFTKSRSKWIVAVKMVSEGVDIPRLRVAVYATNILTELYFRQAVGRVIRSVEGLEEQNAYFYIPKEPVLIGFAQEIKEERDHNLREEIEAALAAEGDTFKAPARSDFSAITATGSLDDVIVDQETVSQAELLIAEQIRTASRLTDPSATLALAFRKFAEMTGAATTMPVHQATPSNGPPLETRKGKLGRLIKTRVAILASLANVEFSHIYSQLNRNQNISTQKLATEDQLKERLLLLGSWIEQEGGSSE